jgi:hypothetical protein
VVYLSVGIIKDKIGVNAETIGKWKHGTTVPTPAHKAKLEQCFRIPVGDWDVPPKKPIYNGTMRKGETEAPEVVEVQPTLAEKLRSGDPLEDETKDTPSRASEPKPKLAKAPLGNTIDEINRQIQSIREDLAAGNRLPSEISRLRDAERAALALRAKLEKERELLEDRVVRDHPAWKRLQTQILAALRPYPAASKAVLDAIERSLS